MDPVASGLTILSTVRKAVKLAKKLYNAPQELIELQVEVDTFASVFNSVALTTFELRTGNEHVGAAIRSTQACLLELQKVIVYELTKDVPEGKKGRRLAWLQKVGKVHELLEKLSECRANVILALDCETAVSVRRSEGAIVELQDEMRQKSADIEQSLRDLGCGHQQAQGLLLERLETYEQRWDTYQRPLLEAQKTQYDRVEMLLKGLSTQRLGPPPDRAHDREIEWKSKAGALSGLPHRPRLSFETALGAENEPNVPAVGSILSDEQERSWTAAGGEVGSLLSSWMRQCEHADVHSLTHVEGATTVLPSRVIFIGDTLDECRLHESYQGERGRYTALSYTWGGVAPIVTTASSLSARKTNIPWTVIPALFRDAIVLTRQLGVRYLWIDSLCIVQDDVSDWEREAGRMAGVYGNSYLTIAAGSASNPSQNLVHHSVRNYLASHGDSSVTYLASLNEWRLDVPTKSTPKRSSLSTRAWALQEVLLSPRSVVFEESSMHWKCSIRQSGVDGLRSGLLPSTDLDAALALHNQGTLTDPFDAWQEAVCEYSRRDLTFESDKLVAISGLARVVADKTKDTYVAGLWQSNIFQGLLWGVERTSSRALTYTAPSWSWASVVGPVTTAPASSGSPLAKLVRWAVATLGQNELGALQSASITLKASCVEAQVEGLERSPNDNEDGESRGDQVLVHLHRGKVRIVTEVDTLEDLPIGSLVLCVKISQGDGGNIHALVLRTASNGTWRRIAVMELFRRRGEHRWFEDAVEREVEIV